MTDADRLLAALRAAAADRDFAAAHREQVRADAAWLAARPDEAAKAREPVYRGWFLDAADVPFLPAG